MQYGFVPQRQFNFFSQKLTLSLAMFKMDFSQYFYYVDEVQESHWYCPMRLHCVIYVNYTLNKGLNTWYLLHGGNEASCSLCGEFINPWFLSNRSRKIVNLVPSLYVISSHLWLLYMNKLTKRGLFEDVRLQKTFFGQVYGYASFFTPHSIVMGAYNFLDLATRLKMGLKQCKFLLRREPPSDQSIR